MARRKRLGIPGTYLSTLHAAPGRVLCRDGADRQSFGVIADDAAERFECRFFGYRAGEDALEVVIRVPTGGFGPVAQLIASQFARYMNERDGTPGVQAFHSGRRREVCIEPSLIPEAVSYVCWQGVRRGLPGILKPAHDAASCLRAFLGLEAPLLRLETAAVLRLIGRKSKDPARTFEEFFARPLDADVARGLESGFPWDERAFGNLAFARALGLHPPAPSLFTSLEELERAVKLELGLPLGRLLRELSGSEAKLACAVVAAQARLDGVAPYTASASWLGRSVSVLSEDVARYRGSDEQSAAVRELFTRAGTERLAARLKQPMSSEGSSEEAQERQAPRQAG